MAKNTIEIVIMALDKASGNLAKVAKSAQQIGGALLKVSAVGVGVFVGMAKVAGDFEASLKNAMTMSGLTGKAYEDMSKKVGGLALDMSKKFGIAGTEINDAFYQVQSAGVKVGTKEFEKLADTALMLAGVTRLDTANAVEFLGDTIHIFGMKMTDANRVADIFFKASMLGSTTVPQLSMAMRQAGKVAAGMGIPLEDTAAILTMFASQGLKGAEAGTAFRNIISRLSGPKSKEAIAIVEKLGIKMFDVHGKTRPMIDVFKELQEKMKGMTTQQKAYTVKTLAGEEALDKLLGVMNANMDVTEEWKEELKKSGALQEAFKEMQKGLNFQFSRAIESIKGVVIVLADKFLPILTTIIGKIVELSKKIIEWVENNPKLTETALLIAGIITVLTGLVGGILTIVGTVGVAVPSIIAGIVAIKAAFAALTATMLTNPIVLIIMAIIAIIALLVIAWKTNFLGIRDITKTVFDAVVYILTSWKNHIVAIFTAIWEFIKPAVELWWNFMKAGFKLYIEIYIAIFKTLWNAIVWVWNNIKESYNMTFKPLLEEIGKAIKVAVDFWVKLWEGLKEKIIDIWKTIEPVVMPFINKLANGITGIWEGMIDGIKRAWLKFMTWFIGEYGEIIGTIQAMGGGETKLPVSISKGTAEGFVGGTTREEAITRGISIMASGITRQNIILAKGVSEVTNTVEENLSNTISSIQESKDKNAKALSSVITTLKDNDEMIVRTIGVLSFISQEGDKKVKEEISDTKEKMKEDNIKRDKNLQDILYTTRDGGININDRLDNILGQDKQNVITIADDMTEQSEAVKKATEKAKETGEKIAGKIGESGTALSGILSLISEKIYAIAYAVRDKITGLGVLTNSSRDNGAILLKILNTLLQGATSTSTPTATTSTTATPTTPTTTTTQPPRANPVTTQPPWANPVTTQPDVTRGGIAPIILQVGTLIADERGLEELERKLRRVRLIEATRGVR